MILHLIFDDKFADYAINQFMVYGGSTFVLVSEDNEPSVHYIKQLDKIRIIQHNSEEYAIFLRDVAIYKAIIVHGFYTPWQVDIVNHMQPNQKLAWAFWGGDLYQRPDRRDIYLAPYTSLLQKIHNIVKPSTKDDYFVPFEILVKSHYLLEDSYENFKDVQTYLKCPNLGHLWYAYYSIEETIGTELLETKIVGQNILLGHTAGIRTNHVDGFKALKRMSLENIDVIVPLSYGLPWYRNVILKLGGLFLGKHFCPLTSFMPRSEYNQLLSSCSAVIMPTYKPEGMGNCLTALWMGARLYMYKCNLQYQYFKRLGLIVYTIDDDLNSNNKQWNQPLTLEQIEQNRSILKEYYSVNHIHEQVKYIITALDN